MNQGRLGIGTGTPPSPLSVVTSSATAMNIDNWSNSQTTPAAILLRKNKGTDFSTNADVVDDTFLGAIYFQGMNDHTSADYESGAYIAAVVDGNPGTQNNDMPTELIFATSPDNSANPQVRLTIDKVGEVGIGEVSPDNRLHVTESAHTKECLKLEHTADYTSVTPHGMIVDFTHANSPDNTTSFSTVPRIQLLQDLQYIQMEMCIQLMVMLSSQIEI